MIMHMLGGADSLTKELILIGDEIDLRRLVQLLRAPTLGQMPLDPIEGEPAVRPITVLRLDTRDGPITIRVADDIAIITGSSSHYEALAIELELFMEHNDLCEPGMHMHVDASCDLLGDQSMELVVAGPVPDS